MKYCKDCRFFKISSIQVNSTPNHPNYDLCLRNSMLQIYQDDPVRGKILKIDTPCQIERNICYTDRCGPDGLFFESK
jgi:hypothetical protein